MRTIKRQNRNKQWGGHLSYNVYKTHQWGHALQRQTGGNFDAFLALVKRKAKKVRKEMDIL